jgi:putative PIN family toxin of toxin-antitoxin system
MRVVLDTNVLISACWKPGGNEARMIELVRAGSLIACVSGALLEEYREVAARKKFDKQRVCLLAAIDTVSASAVLVDPLERCEACTDPDDNLLLECALAADAQFVVTGNLADFPAEWRGVRVVNARAMLP